MVQVFTGILVCCHKVFCLLLDNFRNFVDVFSLGMWTLDRLAQSLLAKADDFGLCVELVDLYFLVDPWTLCSEFFTSVLREEVFAGHLLDSLTVLRQIVDFFVLELIFIGVLLELRSKSGYRLLVLRLLFLVQKGIRLLDVQRSYFWKFQPARASPDQVSRMSVLWTLTNYVITRLPRTAKISVTLFV